MKSNLIHFESNGYATESGTYDPKTLTAIVEANKRLFKNLLVAII